MPVNRCICHQVSFIEIKKIAEAKNLKTLEEIQAAKISCTQCKLCIPYVKMMLKTGKVSFDPNLT